MKLIHLNLKRECVLVELPEGAKLAGLVNNSVYYYSSTMIEGDYPYSHPLPVTYDLLGKFTDLKEEDFEGLVHRSGHYSDLYKSYNTKDVRPYSFGRESFISAIEAETVESRIDLENCYVFKKV